MPRMEQLPGFEFELSPEFEQDRARTLIVGSYAITSLGKLAEQQNYEQMQAFLEATQPHTTVEPFHSQEDMRMAAHQEAKAARSLSKLSRLWLGQDRALQQDHELDAQNEYLTALRRFSAENDFYSLESESPTDITTAVAMHLMDLHTAYSEKDASGKVFKNIPQSPHFSPMFRQGLGIIRAMRRRRGYLNVQVIDHESLGLYLNELSANRAPDGISPDGLDIHTIQLAAGDFNRFCKTTEKPFYEALLESESYRHIHAALLQDMRKLQAELTNKDT